MEEVACQQCRMMNPASASFCTRCGAAIATGAVPGVPAAGSASGWELATAGMAVPPPPMDPLGKLRTEECAGWWQRFGASLLDALIFGLVIVLVAVVVAGVAWVASPDIFDDVDAWAESDDEFAAEGPFSSDSSDDDVFFWTVVAMLVLGAMAVTWETMWTKSSQMAKPGQALAGFRVVQVDGMRRLTMGRSLGRAFAKMLYNIPNFGSLLYLASAFTIGLTGRKQGLHDMMSGTACVRTNALERRGIGPGAHTPAHSMHTPPPPAPTRGTAELPSTDPPATGGPFV